MTQDTAAAARAHFAGLWAKAEASWLSTPTQAAKMVDGVDQPPSYCVTTVVRLARQGSPAFGQIGELLGALRDENPEQFVYPERCVHFTLLGCTQRSPDPTEFTADRVDRIRHLGRRAIEGSGNFSISLEGVGIVGNQVFIQAVPSNPLWIRLRTVLESDLKSIGESPISYENKLPIHVNVLRLTDTTDWSPQNPGRFNWRDLRSPTPSRFGYERHTARATSPCGVSRGSCLTQWSP